MCRFGALGQGLLAPLGVIKSDVLFPHCSSAQMGRCDSCRKQGHMSEKLQCLGSVCNFCNMACLLQYCCLHFEASQHTSNGMASAPPLPSGSKLFKIKVSYPVVCCFSKTIFQFKCLSSSSAASSPLEDESCHCRCCLFSQRLGLPAQRVGRYSDDRLVSTTYILKFSKSIFINFICLTIFIFCILSLHS